MSDAIQTCPVWDLNEGHPLDDARSSAVRELLAAALAFKKANEAWSAAFEAAALRVGDTGLLIRPGGLEELAPETLPLCHESNRCKERLTVAALALSFEVLP